MQHLFCGGKMWVQKMVYRAPNDSFKLGKKNIYMNENAEMPSTVTIKNWGIISLFLDKANVGNCMSTSEPKSNG